MFSASFWRAQLEENSKKTKLPNWGKFCAGQRELCAGVFFDVFWELVLILGKGKNNL